LIFKVIGQGHRVKFLARGYAMLCIALVVGCFVDIGGVVFVFNGLKLLLVVLLILAELLTITITISFHNLP
jgi:hypothetical protein